jgi:hypothetical protein
MAKALCPVAILILAGCCAAPRVARRPQLKASTEMAQAKAVAQRPAVVASAELERAPTPQEPILERHTLEPAQNADVKLFSKFFGGGSASLRIHFTRAALELAVWRKVPSGTITFALLVDRVEVRGRSADGRVVYTKNLPGFVFGDSASGFWKETLTDLPASVSTLSVAFFGNYE